jgi:NADH-quinone oxidoreductase subunit L
MAALMAVFQKDIKRTLAFSTISQLGYMMAGLGAGAFAYSIYHLYTHAFFKALLFLAAGSIFHAVHSLDISDAGGLFRKMKWTGVLFLIGALNLAGFPMTSGFFSKDSVLYGIRETGLEWAYWLLVFGAFLTSFYIFKIFFRAFLGKPGKNFEEAHEADLKMLMPKILLAFLSIVSVFPAFSEVLKPAASGHFELAEAVPGALASLLGIGLAYYMYGLRRFELENLKSSFGTFIYDIFHNRLYIDEFYEAVFLSGYSVLSKAADWFDRTVVDGAVNGTAAVFKFAGRIIKPYEAGQIQRYISFALGALIIIVALLIAVGGMS